MARKQTPTETETAGARAAAWVAVLRSKLTEVLEAVEQAFAATKPGGPLEGLMPSDHLDAVRCEVEDALSAADGIRVDVRTVSFPDLNK